MFAATDGSAMYSLVVWRWITCTFTYIIVDLDFIFQWDIAYFVSNFVAMATRVSRGRICVTSFNSPIPRKPVFDARSLIYLVYKPSYIANFVSNFVPMATGVGRSRICLASFDSPTPKTPCYTQSSRGYLLYKPSYGRFCPKFRCHGNRGWSQ